MGQSELDECLFEAVKTAHLNYTRLAIAAGADPNAHGPDSTTPLHQAVLRNNARISQWLLESGADVAAKDRKGQSPLHVAASNGSLFLVELLIKNHADLEAKDNAKRTAELIAVGRDFPLIAERLREAAKQQGHAARVTKGRSDKGPPQVGG
jgi:ankyrin repeat protein